jgi:aspartyl-tRNA(Asn)/glutamyl-tRNA(Gln) amidotransferase subunit C
MSALSTDDVAYLARLARIEVSPQESQRLAGQLDQILLAVAQVQAAVDDDVPATSHPIALGSDAALAAAPEHAERRFQVPRILDEE